MKIFALDEAPNEAFARAARRGTWRSHPRLGSLCPSCGASLDYLVSPLLIEWLPSSSHTVGDFVWPGFGGEVAVTDRAVKVLRRGKLRGFKLGAVQIVPSSGRLESAEVAGRRRPKFPEGVPRLRELITTRRVHYDRNRSSAKLSRPRCEVCGSERHDIVRPSVEDRISHGPKMGKRSPRLPGKGLYVKEQDLMHDCFFKFEEFSEAILCIEPVRDVILDAGLTNVDFLEYGETF